MTRAGAGDTGSGLGGPVRRVLPLLPVLLLACERSPEPSDEAPPWVDASDRANPIVADVPLYPWPSDQYLVPDDTQRTGRRIALPADLLPPGLTPEMFADHDGFSRVVPILTYVPGGIDPTSLPDHADLAATLDLASSPVLLVRVDTGEPVPALVEVDATADSVELAALIVRPHRPLAPNARYAVLLRDSLRTADGSPAPRSAALDTIFDDEADADPAIAAWEHHLHDLPALLDQLGLTADELIQAWTFHTRSEEQVMHRAQRTQEIVGDVPLGAYTLEEPVIEADRATIYGTLTVPRFLDDNKRMTLGADGEPVEHGTMEAPFLITIPRTVTEARPTVLFGHGFFSAIEETTWSNLFEGLERWQMPAVTTEFFGFSENSLAEAAVILAGQLHQLDTIIHQQLQSQANFTLVHRLMEDVLADAVQIDWGDGPVTPIDGSNLPYMGISNGGTQGLVMMTTSPRLTRGALVVAGGGWSHMLQRASQWATLGLTFSIRYQDNRDLQLVMSLMQQTFDEVDSLNYMDHLLTDRLPGRPADPDLLLLEAVGDAQVNNMVTEWVARAAGFPLVTPSPREVWGLEEVTAPAPDGTPDNAGFVIYDLGLPPLPEGNVAPEENGAHADVRLLEDYRAQMGTFLESGKIVQTCDGACDPD